MELFTIYQCNKFMVLSIILDVLPINRKIIFREQDLQTKNSFEALTESVRAIMFVPNYIVDIEHKNQITSSLLCLPFSSLAVFNCVYLRF